MCNLERRASASAFGLQEPNVPNGSVRDQNGAIEGGEHVAGEGRERWRIGGLFRVDAMNVGVSAVPLAGVDQTMNEPNPLATHHPIDTNLDHAIPSGVEPGHLQVDERERRLGHGQIPRRSGRQRIHGLS